MPEERSFFNFVGTPVKSKEMQAPHRWVGPETERIPPQAC